MTENELYGHIVAIREQGSKHEAQLASVIEHLDKLNGSQEKQDDRLVSLEVYNSALTAKLNTVLKVGIAIAALSLGVSVSHMQEILQLVQ